MEKMIYIVPEAEVELLNSEDVVLVSVVHENESNPKRLPELSYEDIQW